ncbi:MAG: Gldg family protein [Deltaproteobacteria bacterium]|nr:Gldg family protein [Deltaproteobacteria bacterium]MBW2361865.1 Gldg family protein [Deltaproteobacteria bacterium]
MGSSLLLWALGGVAVLFGMLNLFVGIFAQAFDPWWVWGNLAVGVGLLAAAAITNLDALRERMHSGEARRVGRYGSSALLSTALVVAILGLLGFLSTRYQHRFDLSEQQVHSLTSQTENVLAALEEDVEAIALFPTLGVQPVRDLLDRYAYASPRFKVTYADPNERPDVLARTHVSEEDLGQGLLHISFGGESTQVREVTEERVTNALVKLSRTGEKTVYFLEGHGERPVQGEPAATKEGFSRAAEALVNENYRVEKLLLAATGAVPDDADVVVVAGATRPLLEAEQAALQAYLERGGALLTLIDPRAQTDLVDRVRAWGVDIGDDVIVDRRLAIFGQATSPFAQSYDTSHAITKDMRETTLFHMARSVRGREGADFTELVMTGDDSWAERDLDRFFGDGEAELDDADLAGPVSVGVAGTLSFAAASDTEGVATQVEARVAVFGDADFAANERLDAYRNRDLFVNTVNWLMGDVEAISIRPSISRASRFQLSAEQFVRIRTLSLFVLPELLAIIGIWVWWSRRSEAR